VYSQRAYRECKTLEKSRSYESNWNRENSIYKLRIIAWKVKLDKGKVVNRSTSTSFLG